MKSRKGCLMFCRDTTIKRFFGPGNKETIERLQTRLGKKFGKLKSGGQDYTSNKGIEHKNPDALQCRFSS